MSTTVEIEDSEKFQSAISSVRSDDGELVRQSWVLIGHVDQNPNMIHIVDNDNSPGAQISGFVSGLQEDMVMYGLLRHSVTVDMSATIKFIYVHWIGSKVAPSKKGRYGVVHGSVKAIIGDSHLTIETSSLDDLNLELITKQLEESSGVYNKVLENDQHGLPERGFTQHQVKDKKKTVTGIVVPTGPGIKVDDDVLTGIQNVRDDENPLTWVAAGYENGDVKKPLVKCSEGSGDTEEIREILADDQVCYILYRKTEIVHEVPTIKFIFITWVGENVKPMTKAKVSTKKSAVQDIFKTAHFTLFMSSKSELTEASIKSAMSISG
ncbi:uncharacterized protein LOC117118910 [Anneissia japonica]|uniref:uncharacterized protein LOC117118910 n=1 Tax=Anneissia japonica TaxID=1529436 RepID=UPI0014257254|nr:uncharacterized protein LOC117118910 [Anneissia japonica]